MNAEQLTELLDDLFHHYIQMEWYLNQLYAAMSEINTINTEH